MRSSPLFRFTRIPLVGFGANGTMDGTPFPSPRDERMVPAFPRRRELPPPGRGRRMEIFGGALDTPSTPAVGERTLFCEPYRLGPVAYVMAPSSADGPSIIVGAPLLAMNVGDAMGKAWTNERGRSLTGNRSGDRRIQ